MTTALFSDLHLGTNMTVLESSEARARFLGVLEDVDEIVLLGDTLDLRYAPVRRVLELARPFLADLARALGGRRVVFVPGNHDHQLAYPQLERARLNGAALELETVTESRQHGLMGAVAEAMPGARLAVAYPGLWVRPDVYATHGHYLDCHMTTPRGEVIIASVLQRLVGRIPDRATPEDYEDVLTPLYSVCYDLAQAGPSKQEGAAPSSRVLQRMKVSGWRLFEGRSRRGDALLVGAAVAVLNRVGLGPFAPEFSSDAVLAATREAMGEVVGRLGIEAAFVVAGHTHRSGTWPLSNGTALVNAGSWGRSPTPAGRPGPDPYRPGTCVLVRETGAPEVRGVLDDISAAELEPRQPELSAQ